MPKFDHALIITVEADTYENSLREAKEIAKGYAVDPDSNISLVTHYEKDNDGNRILYLHPSDTNTDWYDNDNANA